MDEQREVEQELAKALEAYDRVVAEHEAWDKKRISEMDELRRKLRERELAMEKSCDRAWIAGAQFGWNCGTHAELNSAIDARCRELLRSTPPEEAQR